MAVHTFQPWTSHLFWKEREREGGRGERERRRKEGGREGGKRKEKEGRKIYFQTDKK